jgi:uncharacterized cupredoxin-like copper-binding protein
MKKLKQNLIRDHSPLTTVALHHFITLKPIHIMKIIKLFLAIIVLFSLTTKAQIKKGNWMMGGTGNITSYENKSIQNGNDVGDKGNTINIAPNIGYFFINRLVLGTIGSLSFTNSNRYESRNYGFGPFIRYYFLKEDKRINFFAHANYTFGEYKSGSTITGSNGYRVKAGPVIFFNKNVGMEITLDYNSSKIKVSEPNISSYKALQVSVGFQIHLKK